MNLLDKLKKLTKKQWIGLTSLPIAFTLISLSLKDAPKQFTIPLGATILLAFGYHEGIKKLEKTNNPVKLLKELTCSFFAVLGIALFYYTYTITQPWVTTFIAGAGFFYLSRKLYLNNIDKDTIRKREKEITENNTPIKAYLKKNIVPILFLTLFITSFLYVDNETLLRIEGIGFILILALNRIYWMKSDTNEQ